MFRFTIRDLLWLMVVVGILSLWAMERKWKIDDSAKILKDHDRLQNRVYQQDATIRHLRSRVVTESGDWRSIPPQ